MKEISSDKFLSPEIGLSGALQDRIGEESKNFRAAKSIKFKQSSNSKQQDSNIAKKSTQPQE